MSSPYFFSGLGSTTTATEALISACDSLTSGYLHTGRSYCLTTGHSSFSCLGHSNFYGLGHSTFSGLGHSTFSGLGHSNFSSFGHSFLTHSFNSALHFLDSIKASFNSDVH